jgi:hypothetical protein
MKKIPVYKPSLAALTQVKPEYCYSLELSNGFDCVR